MVTANLRVEGMGCNRCAQAIKDSLGAVNGIGEVEVDLKGKRVAVEYDPAAVDTMTIRLTIENSGYKVG
jgi:copper chaperone